jgi:peptide-methionine (S)-S-oxide reductase
VIRTRVGYTGGQKLNPTYHSLGDHTETLQIDYDPSQISYNNLLEIFWTSHNPTRRPWSRQYMSALFYHDDEQKALALETKARQEAGREGKLFRGKIFTEILPAGRFYRAEDYHQKYLLQKTPELRQEYSAIYPNFTDLVNSTAAARVNGYVGGYGTLTTLEVEMDSLGLSSRGREKLQKIVQRFGR